MHELDILQKTSSDRSIDLCVLRDACHELFCVLGDFYVSGTQDAEVTKTLKTMGNRQPRPLVTTLPIAYSCSNWKVVDSVPAQGPRLLF